MALGGEQFFQHANRVADLDRIVDGFFRDADATLAESLQDVGFRNALQSFKLDIPDDGQFFNDEGDPDAAARSIFDRYLRLGLLKKTESINRLKIACDLIRIVDVTRPGLNPVKNVIFAQTTISLDIDFLDESLLRLLSPHTTGDE